MKMTTIKKSGKDQLMNQSERPSEGTGAGTSTGPGPAGLPGIAPQFYVRYWFPPESQVYLYGHDKKESFDRHKQMIVKKNGVVIDEGLW